jgi:hypothetical protein
MFVEEVDRISKLLNANKVVFKSGDFLPVISDMQPGDFHCTQSSLSRK